MEGDERISTPNNNNDIGDIEDNDRIDLIDIKADLPHSGICNSSTPNSAPRRGILLLTPNTQGRTNRVCFSPVKEIVSFTDDANLSYTVDVDGIDNNNNDRFGKNNGWGDPRMPILISMYLRLGFNVLVTGIFSYIIVILVITVRGDVRRKVELFTMDALKEISRCSREYYKNKCVLSERAPALENQCNIWEKCMNRDPQYIGRSKVTAYTFGEILNSFLEPISWKAIFLMNVIIFGGLFVVNFATFSGFGDNKPEKVKLMEKDERDFFIEDSPLGRRSHGRPHNWRNQLTVKQKTS